MSDIQSKNTKPERKQENITYNKEKHWLIEAVIELVQMSELPVKDIKSYYNCLLDIHALKMRHGRY